MKPTLTLPAIGLLILLWVASVSSAAASGAARQLRLLAPAGYLPDIPMLVRLEVIDAGGLRDWSLWDAEAGLSADSPVVILSTNRIVLRNGLGSALVSFSGGAELELTATLGNLQTNQSLKSMTNLAVTGIGGVLPGPSSTWSGIILVTNDVIVPIGHTLTIQSNTIVLIQGVTDGTVANDISVSGTILSLGTETAPITITCAYPDLNYRWGQIRHINAQPSLYRHTSITRGGRATPEGQTGTAPVIRPLGSKIIFESCNITDHEQTSASAPDFGQPGKIMLASLGSDITFDNCLLARSRMGPEIEQTALLLTNCYIMEMRGVNDSDGIFLNAQQSGQSITLTGSVIVDGDDDGIDTLRSTFTVENCLIRNWRNPFEDSKGISVEGGEARIWHSLLVDNAIGVSGKGDNGETVRVLIDRSTILSEGYALGATNKFGTLPIIDYRVTNSIIQGLSDSIFTQYSPADLHLYYCYLGEPWPGPGNNSGNPLFVNADQHDYHLQPSSPCIDAGDPASALDPDRSRTDIGYFIFIPPAPLLANPQRLLEGTFQFSVQAYPGRDYVIEYSTNLPVWRPFTSVSQVGAIMQISDTNAIDNARRFYRARLAP